MKICIRCKLPRMGDTCQTCEEPLEPIAGLSGYTLLDPLGKGGQGQVFSCIADGQRRAIKIIDPTQLRDARAQAQAERWFNTEVAALERINHPHVIALHQHGRVGPVMFLITSFVRRTLRRVLDRTGAPLSLKQAVRYAAQLADALVYLHDNGILHRDIKPANIGLNKHDQIKLFDFGAAGLNSDARLTTVFGGAYSEPYAAPEQLRGEATTIQTDIYSFGAVLFEMIAGHSHRSSRRAAGVTPNAFYSRPARSLPYDPERPQELDQLVLSCLRIDPLKRPQHTWHLQAILAELSDALNDGFAAICRRWTGLKTEIPQLQAKRERLSKKIRADSKECEERSQTLKALQTQIQLAIRSRDIKQAEATNFDAAAQDAQREFEEIFRRLRDLRADASLAENRAEAAQQQAENARKQRIAAQRLAAEAEASARLAQRQAAEANQALQHAQTLKRSAQDAQAEAEEKRHQMLEEHRTIRRRIANLNKQRAAAEQALVTLTNKDASASKTWSIALPIRQVAIGLLVMGVLTAWIVWMILRTVPVQEALIGIWKVDNEAMIEQLLADPIRAELSDGERQKAAISFKKAMADVRYEFVEDGRFIFTLAKGTRAEGAYTVKAINGKHFVIEGIKEDQSKPEQMNATLEGQQLKIEINGKKVFLVKQMRPFTGSADCSSQRATIR